MDDVPPLWRRRNGLAHRLHKVWGQDHVIFKHDAGWRIPVEKRAHGQQVARVATDFARRELRPIELARKPPRQRIAPSVDCLNPREGNSLSLTTDIHCGKALW